MKPKLVVITGPTAVGKTSLSIKLAQRINGEIISADSMQVYKYLNIGSAKIKPEEMCKIPHHLIDVLDPKDDFNVYLFKKMAKEALDKIYADNHIPIVVGGTGFYIQALLYDIDFTDEDNSKIRIKYEELSQSIGPCKLHELLAKKDPEYAASVHFNNVKKVIRALEFIEINNKKFSEFNNEQRQNDSPYDFNYFVLTDERENIYSNIEKRVDIMVKAGLLDEVTMLKNMGLTKDMNSMQGLGYKEILDYLDGLYTFDEAVAKIKLETRHFAKRQLTWFRREKSVDFINKKDFDYNEEAILKYMINAIDK